MIRIAGLSPLYNLQPMGVDRDDMPLCINSCGYQKFITKDLFIDRPEGRIDYQLIYVCGGACRFYWEGRMQRLGRGGLILYTPGQPQLYEYRHQNHPEIYFVHFTGGNAQEYLEQLGLPSGVSRLSSVRPLYADRFHNIIREMQLHHHGHEAFESSYLLELMAQFSRDLAALNRDRSSDRTMAEVINAMHERYNQKWTVGDYAKISNLSIYWFNHRFKAYTGKTPTAFLTDIRINNAKDFLSMSQLSISEISALVGYDDPLYFSRVFKRVTGLSPRQFRDQS